MTENSQAPKLNRYKTLHLWMIFPMVVMQLGILRDYWGDFSENAWSVHVHYWTGTVWYSKKTLKTYSLAGHENYLATYKQEWLLDAINFIQATDK